MTDPEKQRLGILPESIYMTANLEQWGEELEHMSVRLNTAASTEASAASYQLPQVTFPRNTPPRGTYNIRSKFYYIVCHVNLAVTMSPKEHEGVPLLRNVSGKDVFHLLNVITAMDHAMEHT